MHGYHWINEVTLVQTVLAILKCPCEGCPTNSLPCGSAEDLEGIDDTVVVVVVPTSRVRSP